MSTESPPQQRRKQQRKFSDYEAFALWQERMSDSEIGRALHVSRALIQRWRDTLELPSTQRYRVDTKKYRLLEMEDGTVYAIKDEQMTNSAKSHR